MRVFKYIFFIIFIVSCSPKHASLINNNTDDYLFFPKETDIAQIQFLTSISSSLDIAKQKSKFAASITGSEVTKVIRKPYGFNIKNNKLVVCDVTLRGLEIIDLNERTFEYYLPKGSASFKLPLNCIQDDEGNVYVVDPEKPAVRIYNKEFKLKNSILFTEENKPISIDLDEKNIFIVDNKQNRFNIYNKSTLEYVDYFPKTVLGNDDWLASPTNIAIFEDKVYVTDIGHSNIKVFSKEGEYLQTIGGLGKKLGQFVRPKGIDLDNDGNLYAVDGAFNNVQIFNQKGQLLMFFGGSDNDKGNFYLPTQIQIDYSSTEFFKKYVHPDYDLEYLILVGNQYGRDKISVYGKVKLKK